MMMASMAVAGALTSPWAIAQNALKQVDVLQQGSSTVVKLSMSEPVTATPPAFSVSQPARLALDIAGAINGTGFTTRTVEQGDVRSLSLFQADGKVRVVMNLRTMVPYDTRVEGNDVLVTLAPLAKATAPAAGSKGKADRAEEAAPQDQARQFSPGGGVESSLSAVDFRRGPNGEGRVLVDLSDQNTGIDIRRQANQLIVEFKKSSLPAELRKRLNVTDFGTPVQGITLAERGGNVRLTMDQTGTWEHNAYQADKRFVVEVRPVKYDPNKLVQGERQGYKGEKLTLNFQNVEVRNLLNVIADFTKMNIIASDTVQGSLTIRLQDVPWDQALDIILQTRNLDMRKNGNVMWVAPRAEIAKQEQDTLEAKAKIEDLEPLRTETFQLNYQKADDIVQLLNSDKQRILSKRGSAVVHAGTNQLFVQDVSSKLEEIRRIISKVDIPVRQVQIEARIVEASDKFGQSIGFRLGFINRNPQGPFLGSNMRQSVGGSLASTGYLTGQIADPVPNFSTDGLSVGLRAPGLDSGAQVGQLSMVLFNAAGTRFLNLELSALEADGQGKIISSPRVVTTDQKEASIEQGTELPFQQATSSGATSVSFKKANLSLKVTPQITPDGNVIMKTTINKDSPGRQTVAGFAIDTKRVDTNIMIENGGTVVIGGIYTQDERQDVNKIPVLGDIPYLGNLFRNKLKQESKTELLIFLTPRIVDGRLGVTN
jgi:type IV pilus assembly protein PilQ